VRRSRQYLKFETYPRLRDATAIAMPIDVHHLRCADAAERHCSFRKAADSLSVKQSNLSRRIRDLKDELGVALFERTSGGVKATLAGRDFVSGARRVLNELRMVIDEAKAVGCGETGCVTIGFYTSLSTGNLRDCLARYDRRHPQVNVYTVEGSRARLIDGVESGSIDVAFVIGEPPAKSARSLVLWSERIIVALPDDHHLAQNKTIYWTDLRNEKVLLSERNPGPRQACGLTCCGSAIALFCLRGLPSPVVGQHAGETPVFFGYFLKDNVNMFRTLP
jgi:DNA-binding transcriptional LysR family regulator